MSKKIINFYPEPNSKDFLKNIYNKREFHMYKIQKRDNINNYKDIEKIRKNICEPNKAARDLLPQQIFLKNYINPDTPYKGVLIYHGTGVGKTCAAIQIAETFKKQIQKYNSKIYVIVPGPTIEQNFRKELIEYCTNGIYLDVEDKSNITEYDYKKANIIVSQFYEIITYKKLLRRTIGEKKRNYNNKLIKDDYGNPIRDLSINKITSLSNTIIIVDEAHHLIDNDYGMALQKILNHPDSVNLKLVLLTATPMNNSAKDIVYLMNLLLDKKDKLDISKIFKKETINSYKLEILPNGIQYLKSKCKGYISYLRGTDPITFAKRLDVGTINKKHKFTKLYKCYMEGLQLKAYIKLDKITKNDPLQNKLISACNIILPDIDKKKKITVKYSNTGLEELKTNILKYKNDLNKIIEKKKLVKKSKDLYLSINNKNKLVGSIFKLENLKQFSIKYYNALININKNIINENGPGISFVYQKLIESGISIFEEILNQNGYLNYFEKDTVSQNQLDNVKCSYCGVIKKKHKNIKHEYNPAIYLSITGETDKANINEDELSSTIEDRLNIINKTVNNINNIDGKYVKILIGSVVLTEGVSLKNVKDIHILNAPFHLTSIDQIIGRGIRYCSHYKLMNEKNIFPEVKVYKYVVSLPNNELSIEEELYSKAEYKYLTIKEIERALKQIAIDCPNNYNGNVFADEIKQYKNCEKKKNCPAICDFKSCEYKCDEESLDDFWDEYNKEYFSFKKNELDNNTYNENLIENETQFCKNIIKTLYKNVYAYKLDQLVQEVHKKYNKHQQLLFDDIYVYNAITQLLPITENDFNKFTDYIYDEYNRKSYLIQRGPFYILQEINKNENMSMEERLNYDINISKKLLLKYHIIEQNPNIIKELSETTNYVYDNIYYNSRKYYDIYGIISSKINKFSKNNKYEDILKIVYNNEDKNIIGINCMSKNLIELKKIANNLKITKIHNSKNKLCSDILNKLLELEKNQTGFNKVTYIKIPINHKKYLFPYNIEDRINYLKNKITSIFTDTQNYTININKNKMILKSSKITLMQHDKLKELNGIFKNKNYYFNIY